MPSQSTTEEILLVTIGRSRHTVWVARRGEFVYDANENEYLFEDCRVLSDNWEHPDEAETMASFLIDQH